MNHIYTKIHMGASHGALCAALDADGFALKHGDVAVFINRPWTAAKIMTARRAFIYVRETRPFTVDELAAFPRLVGAKSLTFTGKEVALLEKIRKEATGDGRPPRQLPRAVNA